MTLSVWGGYYVATGLCVPRVVFAPRNRSEGRPERIAVRSRPRGRAPCFAQRNEARPNPKSDNNQKKKNDWVKRKLNEKKKTRDHPPVARHLAPTTPLGRV